MGGWMERERERGHAGRTHGGGAGGPGGPGKGLEFSGLPWPRPVELMLGLTERLGVRT